MKSVVSTLIEIDVVWEEDQEACARLLSLTLSAIPSDEAYEVCRYLRQADFDGQNLICRKTNRTLPDVVKARSVIEKIAIAVLEKRLILPNAITGVLQSALEMRRLARPGFTPPPPQPTIAIPSREALIEETIRETGKREIPLATELRRLTIAALCLSVVLILVLNNFVLDKPLEPIFYVLITLVSVVTLNSVGLIWRFRLPISIRAIISTFFMIGLPYSLVWYYHHREEINWVRENMPVARNNIRIVDIAAQRFIEVNLRTPESLEQLIAPINFIPATYNEEEVLRDPFAGLDADNDKLIFVSRNGHYFIQSRGPNRIHDINPTAFINFENGTYQREIFNYQYDPINGVISNGDVFHISRSMRVDRSQQRIQIDDPIEE